MRFNHLLTIFVFVLMLATAVVLLSNPSFTGRAILEEPACASDADCVQGKVCCLFAGKQAGICELQESCGKIVQLTENEKLPNVEMPAQSDPWLFYGAVLAVLSATLIIILIFYRKNRKDTIER